MLTLKNLSVISHQTSLNRIFDKFLIIRHRKLSAAFSLQSKRVKFVADFPQSEVSSCICLKCLSNKWSKFGMWSDTAIFNIHISKRSHLRPYSILHFVSMSALDIFRQVRDMVNELGLRSRKEQELSISNIHNMLRDPIFCGLLRYGGEIHEGKHEPIITKKLFDSVQEVMSRKSKPHSKGLKPFLYRGFFRCGECGCFITTEEQKSHHYLRCTKRKNPCEQKYVREELITSQVRTELQKVSLPDDWAKWMIAENDKDRQSEVQSSTLFVQNTKDEIFSIENKIEKLMTLYLDNSLSLEEYRETKNQLVNQKQLFKEKLSSFEQKANNRFELTEKFLKANITNAELANEGIPEKILPEFKKVGSNFKILDRTVLFEPRGAWKTLLDSEFGGGNALVSRLRRDPISALKSDFVFWRRVRDLNP